jgi:hypothetical protein
MVPSGEKASTGTPLAACQLANSLLSFVAVLDGLSENKAIQVRAIGKSVCTIGHSFKQGTVEKSVGTVTFQLPVVVSTPPSLPGSFSVLSLLGQPMPWRSCRFELL